MEVVECFNQSQILGLIVGGCFQRLQFGLNRLILLAELRHAAAELFQTCKALLVSNQ